MYVVHLHQDFKQMISVADCLLNNGFNVSINKQEQFLSLKKENLMKIQKLLNAVSSYESAELFQLC